MFDWFAEVPQNIAWSYVDYRIKLISKKLAKLLDLGNDNIAKRVTAQSSEIDSVVEGNSLVVPLASLEKGGTQALSSKICVTRMENDEVMAFSRHCPHLGADLSLGVIDHGNVMCPWHNLPIDPASGASPCKSLKKLKVYPCEVKGDQVYVKTGS